MWVTILQVLASLSILVILHECGHFFPAKWFNTKVEKFYLFFDPWFSLFKVKRGDTEYGIGWLPLGGYVKIAGMIDESFDKEQMEGPAQPWEFRSKPAWQRLIIMLGGVTVNFILGIVIFSLIFFKWGDDYIVNDSLTYGVYVDSLSYEMGLRDGDKIKFLGDTKFEQFNPGTLIKSIVINGLEEVTVERDGRTQKIPIDKRFVADLTKYENKNFRLIGARYPTIIKEVSKGTVAEEIGLLAKDQIIGLNGKSTPFFHEFQETFGERDDDNLVLSILRNGTDTLSMPATLKEGRLGVFWNMDTDFFETQAQRYSFGESWGVGLNKSYSFLKDQITAFGKMFSGEIKAKDSLGSFISIGKMFGSEWDWRRFWSMTAMLSLLLGFLNLLPIPALDGGHVMFLLYEVLTGRKPSDKVVEYATLAGFIVLIVLMVYVLGLDIMRHI